MHNKSMQDYIYAIIGISIIFVVTSIGALFVFFIGNKGISDKLSRILTGFAAGCMIYIAAEEMIPELKAHEHDHWGVWAFILGFIVMMILDCIQF